MKLKKNMLQDSLYIFAMQKLLERHLHMREPENCEDLEL